MLYDLSKEPPEAGSLMEFLMIMVSKRRQEARVWETRVLVEASLAPHMKDNKLQEMLSSYLNSVFPYLSKSTADKNAEAKEALDKWTGVKTLKVSPLIKTKSAPLVSKLKFKSVIGGES